MTSQPFWGPESLASATADAAAPTPVERRWGAGSVALVVMFAIATQVALAVVVVIALIAKTDFTDPSAAAKSVDDVMKMAISASVVIAAFVVTWASFIGGPYAVTRFAGLRSMKRDFGLAFKPIDLAIGAGTAVILQGAQFALAQLVDLEAADNTGIVTDQRGWALVVICVGACLITPFAEELFFRGFLLRAIMRTAPGGWWPPDQEGRAPRTGKVTAVVAAVTTSTIFGVLHVTPSGSVAGTVTLMATTGTIGLVFAAIAIKAQRIGPTIVAHCIFNTISIVTTLAMAGRF